MAEPASGPVSGLEVPAPIPAAPLDAALAPPLEPSPEPAAARRHLAKQALAALGIVYGDIGTSPLYAVRECFHGAHAVAPTPANVLGVLSLVFWALAIIVTGKYVAYVLRADNEGEGGILALLALSGPSVQRPRVRYVVSALGIFGAALLYGDGAITPAVSVLSAVEGLSVAAPELHGVVLPLSVAILAALFAVQRSGTGHLGVVFGPIMLVWFVALGALGLGHLAQSPEVLTALSPVHGVRFLSQNGFGAFGVLGAVFLVVTGGEALYADLGHFGPRPIRRAWFALVFPALLLNYLGQGALLLRDPGAAPSPFFRMIPGPLLLVGVALSTAAAVIASQALISGVYSLTRQATMLGLLPRLNIRHTSAEERGQIYIPAMTWAQLVATVCLVLGFQSSGNLAAAYGVAVTLTMVITTVLACILLKHRFRWSWPAAVGLSLVFLLPEGAFTLANLAKIPQGGWFPLLVGAGLFTVMTTWRRGRQILAQRFAERLLPLERFFQRVAAEKPPRVPGTAVFMTSAAAGTPPALLHNYQHNHVLHERVVLLTVVTAVSARVADAERAVVTELGSGVVRVVVRYGFMEQPSAPKLLVSLGLVPEDLQGVTFFLGRETMIASERAGMARWRVRLFALLSRNADPATRFFEIPPDSVLEIGAQIEL